MERADDELSDAKDEVPQPKLQTSLPLPSQKQASKCLVVATGHRPNALQVRRLRQRDSTANSRSSISRDRSRGRSRVQVVVQLSDVAADIGCDDEATMMRLTSLVMQFDDEVEHRTDLRQLQRRLDQACSVTLL